MNKEERISRAVGLYREGYNCSQAVCAAFADLYGLTGEQAMRVSASFGGGIGRMRETCGAACGMFILAGLDCGTTRADDREGKLHNCEVVRELAAEFRRRMGSMVCAELLGLTANRKAPSTPTIPISPDNPPFQNPPAATPALRKRPCVETIAEAARIFAEYFEKAHETSPSIHSPLNEISLT